MDDPAADTEAASAPASAEPLGRVGGFLRGTTRQLHDSWKLLHHLIAFGLITLGLVFRKSPLDRGLLARETLGHLTRLALRLLPLILVLSLGLGFVVIGQTVSLLNRVGAENWLGTVMVATVVREIGPLLTALIMLARSGTANVIELRTARAREDVRSLEVSGVDPIQYLAVPRVLALAIGCFALSMYLILGTVLSGYLWAFLEDVPLLPGRYFSQLVEALHPIDFVMLIGKTLCFGTIIALVTSYHGLRRLRSDEVASAAVRAVGQCILLFMITELGFLLFYLAL